MFLRIVSNEHSQIDPIEAALRLVVDGITGGRAGRPAPERTTGIARIRRLIADRAWTDAALALVELELPQWRLRRLVCEDGEWFCSLSMRPGCPEEIDEPAEGRHAELPLAIMQAAIEARKRSRSRRGDQTLRTPRIGQEAQPMLCCDNFG